MPEPELIHFENQVETQPLEAVDKTRNGVHHTLNLITGPAGNQNIQIPSNRPFKIVFKGGGTGLSVVDNNALDGEATVQLPSGMLEGYIQARGKPNQSITYSDAIYHSEQVLSHSKKPQWYRIGKRPMPIPSDWHSEDGADYVLHFDNQGQENISFRWYPIGDNEEPDYPVGMKLIGPEGGVVELPGVGKLELPAGALTEKTLVRMSQVFEVKEILVSDFHSGEVRRGYDFISSVVKLEPFNLVLEKPAILLLQTNLERLGNNSPGVISWNSSLNLDDWRHVNTRAGGLDKPQWTVSMPVEVDAFKYYTKFISSLIKPNSGVEIYRSPDSEVDPEILNDLSSSDF